MNSLGVLLLKSVGAGYGALNIAGRNSKLKILEFAPLGQQSHLVVLGTFQDVQNFIIGLRTSDIQRSLVLENITEEILQNYAGRNTSHFQNFALVFESHFIGDLFQYALEFSGMGLKIVDFRMQRTTNSPSYLVMTGNDAENIKSYTQDLKRENIQITYISSLSDGFREYLDFKVDELKA